LTIPTTDGRGEGTTFVTAFRARRAGNAYAGTGTLAGQAGADSEAAEQLTTSHTSDQISARIPSPREGSQYADAEAGAEGKRRGADWRRATLLLLRSFLWRWDSSIA
jgi:hypothetical protein